MTSPNMTKQRIVDLLKAKTINLTSIAERLGLSDSTIKQHLGELLKAGRIECITFSKDTRKYYRAIE